MRENTFKADLDERLRSAFFPNLSQVIGPMNKENLARDLSIKSTHLKPTNSFIAEAIVSTISKRGGGRSVLGKDKPHPVSVIERVQLRRGPNNETNPEKIAAVVTFTSVIYKEAAVSALRSPISTTASTRGTNTTKIAVSDAKLRFRPANLAFNSSTSVLANVGRRLKDKSRATQPISNYDITGIWANNKPSISFAVKLIPGTPPKRITVDPDLLMDEASGEKYLTEMLTKSIPDVNWSSVMEDTSADFTKFCSQLKQLREKAQKPRAPQPSQSS